ncbi:hypothetical protein [Nioella sp. MMSF_3534]|uniref:hypothetical protein n=1 Tax=Nioella sp. MMSF_3534 TaxID=3046720 RepID=UPI00273FFE9F|nr:hypothetical protein [Nioella sp. MMSF_3534]
MTAPDPMLASALLVVLETDERFTSPEDREILQLAWDEIHDRLAAGAEVNGVLTDDYGSTGSLLARAIGWQCYDIAKLLLAHGAAPTDPLTGHIGAYEAAFDQPQMIRLLMEHGADATLFDRDDLPAALGTDRIPETPVPPDMPDRYFTAQRGTRNPQPCDNPFFLNQIRTFHTAYWGAKSAGRDPADRRGIHPIFSFDRFGRTVTRLPDGRFVLIAGEHEDSYDSDFCIYNDVCVLDGDGNVDYFLYPVEDFPPTDFHSATLLDDHILIIGCLGYRTQRQDGVAPVLRLDLETWRVTPVDTTGDNPGWIHRHRAELVDGQIIVSGGCTEPGFRANPDRFALTLKTMRWHRIS